MSQLADLSVDAAALDAEGRCVVIEFPAFVLFGVYSPANSSGTRDDFSMGFREALDTRIRNLANAGRNVILTGDLNVSREGIDSARSEESMREASETLEQYLNRPTRRLFNQLLENGKVPGERDEGREKPVLWDICREFHPTREGMYTHWEQKINARPGNFGSRIDFVLCSIEIKDWFADSNIQEGLMGSDHCPVYASTKDEVNWHGVQMHIADILNPPGMFKDGKRLRDFDPAKDALPTSGKLLPEFTKRRSIKDMFAKKPTLSTAKSTPAVASAPLDMPERSQADVKGEATPTQNYHLLSTTVIPAASASPLNAPMKRRLSAASPTKSVKRGKLSLKHSRSQPSAKGQQSLKGFFTAKPPEIKPECTSESSPGDFPTVSEDLAQTPPPSSATSHTIDTEPFIDPEASQQSWSKLFTKKPPPRCEHGELCTSFTVKKPGANCGRQFFLCPRWVPHANS